MSGNATSAPDGAGKGRVPANRDARPRIKRPRNDPKVPPEMRDFIVPWLRGKIEHYEQMMDTLKRALKLHRLPQIENNLKYLENCVSNCRLLIYQAGGRPARQRKPHEEADDVARVGTAGGEQRAGEPISGGGGDGGSHTRVAG